MKIGIKEARKAAGLSQGKSAEMLNVTQPTFSGWETGAYSPSLNSVIAMCELFLVTPNQLLGIGEGAKRLLPNFPHEKRNVLMATANLSPTAITLAERFETLDDSGRIKVEAALIDEERRIKTEGERKKPVQPSDSSSNAFQISYVTESGHGYSETKKTDASSAG